MSYLTFFQTYIKRIDCYFLSAYAHSRSIEIKKKASILWRLNCVIVFAFFFAGIFINLITAFKLFSALTEIITSVLLIIPFIFLKKGLYQTASNLSISLILLGVSIPGLNGYSENSFLDLVLLGINLMAVIFYSCLIGYNKFAPLFATVFSWAAILVYFFSKLLYYSEFKYLPFSDRFPLLTTVLLVVALTGLIAIFILVIYQNTICLAETEMERLSVTIRSIGEGVITTDKNGNIMLMNQVAEELTGYDLNFARGRPIHEIYQIVNEENKESKENKEIQESLLKNVLKNGKMIDLSAQAIMISKTGLKRIIASNSAPIKYSDGNIIGAVLVFRDITQKQQIEERLRNSQRLESLGVLAGGIAHDFNNLLSGIYGHIEIAQEHLMDMTTNRAREHLDKTMDVFERAKDLSRQLLTFAKGGLPIKRVMNIESLLQQNTNFVLSGSNVTPIFEIDEDLFECEVDDHQLGQVIGNIVLNAREAMSSGGKIFITAQNISSGDIIQFSSATELLQNRGYVLIRIKDEGAGISPDDLSRIFDPYFTSKPHGIGLGLAIVYSIIKKHDGHIEVESVPSIGTTFSIFLPVVSHAQSEEKLKQDVSKEIDSKVEKRNQGHKNVRILVMDDENAILNIMKIRLEQAGYDVSCTVNGEQAIKTFKQELQRGNRFDVVILDLTIPGGIGGKEVLNQMLLIDPSVKSIASSGYSNDPIIANPTHFRFTDRLLKPYTSQELYQLLNKLCE
ncbi:MAG: response regulator [Oligoflexia bacterium]|nr:response regulator [Oligoflexia bacterium]